MTNIEKGPKVNFPYAGTEERYKKWEKEPVKVINVVQELNLPSLQNIENKELTPKKAIDIDNRALREPNCTAVVYGRPHAGEFIPESFWGRLSEEGKKTLAVIDRGTTDIFKSENIPSVGTKISRFITDPNRAPLLDMDSKNTKVPEKVLWYKGAFNEDIYLEGKEPTKNEVEDLVERFYLPYYNGMMGVIGSLADRRKNAGERILVIDGHSFSTSEIFKSYYEEYGLKDPDNLPMFILGDADGETCDKDIKDAFTRELEKNFKELDEDVRKELMGNIKGGLTGTNKPFKGVHNVHFYGQREQGINSFQLECNESAYVDEKNGDYYTASYKEKNIQIVQKLIEKTCRDIDSILKSK